MLAYLQMMPGGQSTPTGWNMGSVWMAWMLSFLVLAVIIILVVALYFRRAEPPASAALNYYQAKTELIHRGERRTVGTMAAQSQLPVLAEVLKSLAPTLADDERRVMDEMVKAGGEMLQSDLPRMTDFSKSTVSKAIHGLETRGIILRERHKWTYWCKINPRLVERVQHVDAASGDSPASDEELEPLTA